MYACGFGAIMLALACVYFFFVIVFLALKGINHYNNNNYV